MKTPSRSRHKGSKSDIYKQQQTLRINERKINHYLMARSKKMLPAVDDKNKLQNHYENMKAAYRDKGWKGVKHYEKLYRRAIKERKWRAFFIKLALRFKLITVKRENERV